MFRRSSEKLTARRSHSHFISHVQLHYDGVLVGNRQLDALVLQAQLLPAVNIVCPRVLSRMGDTLRLISGGIVNDHEQASFGAGNESWT